MLVAFLFAVLLQSQGNPCSVTSEPDQIYLISETKFKPTTGQLEAMVADRTLSGLPGIRCEGFSPAVHLWRVGCLNDTSTGRVVVVREVGEEPTILAALEYKLMFLRSFGLHDRIIIRTLGLGGNGEAVQAEYVWKPPRN